MKLTFRFLGLFLCAALVLSTAAAAAPAPVKIIESREVYEEFPDLSVGFSPEAALLFDSGESSYESVKETLRKEISAFPYNGERTVELTFTGSGQELEIWCEQTLEKAYFNAVYDYPQDLFFVQTEFNWSAQGIGDRWTVTVTPSLYDSIVSGYAAVLFQNARDFACIEAFGSTDAANSGLSDLEKVAAAHDWIVTHCRYDPLVGHNMEGAASWTSPFGTEFQSDDLIRSPFDVFVNGNAVCQGYAIAFNAMMQRAGISSSYINSSSAGHGWNLVEVEGQQYHIDCTHDDPIFGGDINDYTGHVEREYFLKSDESMKDPSHGYGSDWSSEYSFSCPQDYVLPQALAESAAVAVYRVGPQLCVARQDGSLHFYDVGTNFESEFAAVPLGLVPDAAAYNFETGTYYYGTDSSVYSLEMNGRAISKLAVYSEARWGSGLSIYRNPDGSSVLLCQYCFEPFLVLDAGMQTAHTVTLELNGGEGTKSLTKYYRQSVEIPDPTRAGYTFSGWCVDPELKHPLNAYGLSSMPFGSFTLYAAWEAEEGTEPPEEKEMLRIRLENGTLYYEISLPENVRAQAVICRYDSSGRLLGAEFQEARSGSISVDGALFQVFLLEQNSFLPLCAGQSIRNPGGGFGS